MMKIVKQIGIINAIFIAMLVVIALALLSMMIQERSLDEMCSHLNAFSLLIYLVLLISLLVEFKTKGAFFSIKAYWRRAH